MQQLQQRPPTDVQKKDIKIHQTKSKAQKRPKKETLTQLKVGNTGKAKGKDMELVGTADSKDIREGNVQSG